MRRIGYSLIFSASLAVGSGNPGGDSLSMEVSSGGVSLGSYQGGYLLARTLAAPESTAFRILTGASAGAINMLGGLYYSFHGPRRHWSPYKAWLGIGWDNLKPGHPEGGHLFQTRAIEAALDPIIDSILTPPDRNSGAPEVVWLGFAITRFLPRYLDPQGLNSPKMDEKITIGIQWLPNGNPACLAAGKPGGCWRAWTETNPEWGARSPQPFVDFGPSGTDVAAIARNLKDLALASSAFPVAFPRHGVRLALLDSGLNSERYTRRAKVWRDTCLPYTTTEDKGLANDSVFLMVPAGDMPYGKWEQARYPSFSDGGIFENEPLFLAQRIRENLRKSYPQVQNLSSVGVVSPLRYDSLFAGAGEIRVFRSDIPEWIIFWTGRHGEASSRMEVTRFLEQRDFADGRLRMSTTSMPLAGEHFQHFSAFFRKSFRDFDFTVGLRDGFHQHLAVSGEAKRDSALALLRPFEPEIAEDLEYLWGQIDTLYSALSAAESKSRREHGTGSESIVRRFEAQADTLDALFGKSRRVMATGEASTRLAGVFRGSLGRMRGTMRALARSDEEKDRNRFDNFAEGFKTPIHESRRPPGRWAEGSLLRPATDSTYFLGRTIADSLYRGLAELIAADSLGTGNSFYYPMALYHARTAIGAATGALPSFHTPYLRIDGGKSGFRLMQGIPFGFNRFGAEAGLHFLEGRLASRFEAHVYGEFSLNWIVHANFGIAAETPADYRNLWAWPRIDLVVLDVITFGLDFRGRWNFPSGRSHFGGAPVFSLGSRIGFDLWVLSKGTLRGTNADRRIK